MIGLVFSKENLKNISNFDVNFAKNKTNLLFIVIEDDIFLKLENSNNKKLFFTSPDFKIIYSWYGYYKNNSIFLDNLSSEYIDLFLITLNLFFEEDVVIYANYDRYGEKLIENGFQAPVSCLENSICLKKKNNFSEHIDFVNVHNQINYYNHNKDKSTCNLHIKLSENASRYLNYLTTAGVSIKDRLQKEVTGSFKVSRVEQDYIHVLDINKESIKPGNDDNVSASLGLYTFHSHPFQAYLKYKSKLGIPSISDYIATFILAKNYGNLAHIISTLEGIYIIVVNRYSEKFNQPVDQVISFIKKNLFRDEPDNIEKYISDINKFDLFNLTFLDWEKSVNPIEIKFNKSPIGCVTIEI